MRAPGFTLVEAGLVLAVLGLVAAGSALALRPGPAALRLLDADLRGALLEAALGARARGADRRLWLGGGGVDVGPVRLPPGLAWGALDPVTFPPAMAPTVRAHLPGACRAPVTFSPRGTAMAACWFVTCGSDALCLRLADEGQVRLHRRRQGIWTED